MTIAVPLGTDSTEAIYSDQFARFTAETGVEVNLLPFPDPRYAESIQALFQSGEVPDVFRMVKPPAFMAPSWSKGWIQPLDDYEVITDLLANEYGESALDPAISGLHIGGELYGVPGVRNEDWSAGAFMTNPDILSQHGIAEPLQTWSEMRDAAAKVTADSGGDVFGFALFGSGPLLTSLNLRRLHTTAGPVREVVDRIPVDYQTGRAGASHPSLVESVAFLRGLVEDGSVVPGWQNLDAQAFWQAWTTGKIAMAPIASWWAEQIRKIDGDAAMAFSAMPVQDSGRKAYESRVFDWAPDWGMTREAQNPEAAAALIAFLGGLEFQQKFYNTVGVPTALADGYADELSDIVKDIIALEPEARRRGPNPLVRSADAQDLLQAIQQRAPEPGFYEIVFSAVDNGDDYAELAGAYDAELDKVITDEIASAIETGADFDENILTFPDWDPLADYTTEPSS